MKYRQMLPDLLGEDAWPIFEIVSKYRVYDLGLVWPGLRRRGQYSFAENWFLRQDR